jgi:hypothetical protein
LKSCKQVVFRLDVRALIAAQRAEGLKANSIHHNLKVLTALYSFARDDLGVERRSLTLLPACFEFLKPL